MLRRREALSGEPRQSDTKTGAVTTVEEPDDESDEGEAEGNSDEGTGIQNGPGSGYPGGAEEWEEILACPLNIRFTQDKIHPFFYRRGPIVNVLPKIRAVPSSDGEVLDLIPPFAPIHCLQKGEELWSMDNRRLYALQLAAMDLWPRRCRVRCLRRERLPRHKLKTQYRKFNTTSSGRCIDVCTRYQQFDTWSWYERALEIEGYSLSRRLGAMLCIFEAAPVLGALLFRSGITGFESRRPLVVGFLLAFGIDFLRQQVPAFERFLSAFQVQAILDGETMQMTPWWNKEEGEEHGVCSAQLAAIMAVALMLLLPYILGIARDKVRSSLLSCWLGVAFMLTVQLVSVGWRLRRGFASASAAVDPFLHGKDAHETGEDAEGTSQPSQAGEVQQ
ncbi:hhaIM [Symbiodinium pilosum]|uniref:HhaIM protein n=1 Tax=Symbiodinium pilosum TaxID=2952 RepID=A0A812X957_SYMPI|nr:hhaIM [Symbiodinium pilosum]